VREIHNVSIMRIGGRTEVSLHLKLPGELSLAEAHEIASRVEAAIEESLPAVDAVQTHLEPLSEPTRVRATVLPEAEPFRELVRQATGDEPRRLRLLATDEGPVVFLTVRVAPETPLAEAHGRASAIEATIREARPEVADVIVHTEP
jgi:divalent metal cation (Fe/Co/Zn/Cd) transporter